ncbi:ABC-2 family transporter protein [Enterococcus durans]|uniref:ABC-2 family transporter protein n=1 Tax=Enterococcus durans TaxID=53345 RepID=A0A377KM38_9ENTE|nr:hypothetical protein [Enterococcus durans]STP30229.1 ABC-2 family transporter protein [Enterococcus durans]
MKNYFKLELKFFFHDRKNQVIFIITFFASLFYAWHIFPQETPIEVVNPSAIQVRFQERQAFLDQLDVSENSHPLVKFAQQTYPKWNQLDKKRLDSLAAKNYQAYAETTAKWYAFSDQIYRQKLVDSLRYPDQYYAEQNPYGFYDGHFAFQREIAKYKALAKSKNPLTISIFNEKTAWQTIYRLSQSILPLLLLTVTAFFAGNSLVKDRERQSIVDGYPLGKIQRLFVKTLVIFTGIVGILLSFLPSFLLIGLQKGFGNLSLPIPIHTNDFLNNGHFHIMSLGNYLLIWSGFLILWLLFLISLNFCLSFFFKNEVLNVMILLLLIFSEQSYFRRGIGSYYHFDWLPTSYVRFGEIITGYRSFLYSSISYTLQSGLVTLLISSAIMILIVSIFSRRKGRLL